tara:strand:- start:117 stop:374 length:258 start_codon:yes stop_codon:yes gene_type:complete
MAILFPIVYSAAIIFLIWKAFKVMSTGWSVMDKNEGTPVNLKYPKKYTIHPELLDKAGNITDEELLTVRFSNDSDSPLEKGTTPD